MIILKVKTNSRIPSAFILVFFLIWVALPCFSEESTPEKPEPQRKAFKADRLVLIDKPDLTPGVLLVKGGEIEKVLEVDDSVPEGVELVDLGRDSVVYPLLVNPLSQIHLSKPTRPISRHSRGRASSGRGNLFF